MYPKLENKIKIEVTGTLVFSPSITSTMQVLNPFLPGQCRYLILYYLDNASVSTLSYPDNAFFLTLS